MKNKCHCQYDNFGRILKGNGLGMPYAPISESCNKLDVDVPDSMGVETHEAINRIKGLIGGNVVDFVADRLGYESGIELCKGLASEQIDAVAVCIYNIEAHGEALIIGDQTGIGKGRQAASIIRYAVEQGLKPVFLTEKANLFSDLYRDMVAIGSGDLKPFIVNSKEAKTDIKNEEGEIVYQAPEKAKQDKIIKAHGEPFMPVGIDSPLQEYDYILATYSQFNTGGVKQVFLKNVSFNNIMILDESHNASGASETGAFIQNVVSDAKGVLFLSATFAKRPDNMPVYALKTAIREANMSQEDLISSITRGGVALQEILASQLVKEGQMLRRERSYEGIEVNYFILEKLAAQHRKTADTITEIIRDIIDFQTNFLQKEVDNLDKIAAAQNKETEVRKGTKGAGVDATPYFSKVFNIINQMLFSIKAEAIADRAIQRLKEGKKPVIAFYSTMETFLSDVGVPEGETFNADFSIVLMRGLDGVMRYTEKDAKGNPEYKKFDLPSLPIDTQMKYKMILQKIKNVSTGISISPIDVLRTKIEQAGFSVVEVTGRSQELQINLKNMSAIMMPRKKVRTNDAFRMFNNNEVDCLMINQTGSTGASAHAIPTKKVPASEVKQRVMEVLQPELDINKEVQKRGRINRTGQILLPIYDYNSSAIPAESRLMMMLQKKLKSLDANTSSNQRNSSSLLNVPDFLNKIGDRVVYEYLLENPKINLILNDPLDIKSPEGNNESASAEKIDGAASKVSGRVAILSCDMQENFYNEISARYNDQVEYLKQTGEYDLEVETMNLQAKVLKSQIVIKGKGGRSEFGTDSILELCECNVLKKPFKKDEVEKMLRDELKGREAAAVQSELIAEYENYVAKKLTQDIDESKTAYKKLISEIPNERKIKLIENAAAKELAIIDRTTELNDALTDEISNHEKGASNRASYLLNFFNYFYIGRGINYPITSFEEGQVFSKAIFVGVSIDKKRSNPYAPSAVKFKFAIADSNKFVALVASGAQGQKLQAIIGASYKMSTDESLDILIDWTELIKKSSSNRQNRYILTGNILQAFKDYKGRLVSYTTAESSVKKGILMPENWTTKDSGKGENTVSVPINFISDIILNTQSNSQFITSIGVRIYKGYDDEFVLFVPASRQKAGHIFLDSDLLALVQGNNFNKVSDTMKAFVTARNMKAVIDILQSKFSAAVNVNANLLENKSLKAKRPNDVHLKLNHKPKKINQVPTDDFELEAMALELELELLNF